MTDMNPEPTDDEGAAGDSPVIRDLRAKAKRTTDAETEAAKYKAEAEDAKRELLLGKLGIDASKGTGKLFAQSYKGELSEDAMRTAANEYELIPAVNASPETVAAAQKAAAVSQGSEHTTTVSDWQGEFEQIPRFGQPGWEKGKAQLLEIAQRHGMQVTRDRPRKVNVINPVTGKPLNIAADQAATRPT